MENHKCQSFLVLMGKKTWILFFFRPNADAVSAIAVRNDSNVVVSTGRTNLSKCLIGAFRLKEHSMPAPCNKCRSGLQVDGDSWCLGCSAQETSLRLLKRRWNNPGLRQVAEETLISSARLLRAFANVDSNLVTAAAKNPHPLTAAKSKPERKRSRTPPRDERPPLVRQSPRERSADRRSEVDYGGESQSYSAESEEEEERATDKALPIPPPPPVPPEHKEEARGSRPPPEPPFPPPRRGGEAEERAEHRRKRSERPRRAEGDEDHPKPKKKKKKNKHRGGTKHQRRWRETTDPFRASHRKLDQSYLQLSTSLDEGLERRA